MRAFHHSSVEVSSISKKKQKTKTKKQNSPLCFLVIFILFFPKKKTPHHHQYRHSLYQVGIWNWLIDWFYAPGLSCHTWGLHSLLGHTDSSDCGMQALSFGMWSLVPWPGIEPAPLALGPQSLNHGAAREIPGMYDLNDLEKSSKTCWILNKCRL